MPKLSGVLPVLVMIPVLIGLDAATRSMPFFSYIALTVGVNVILAVSLNIINGMTGQFSIGHAGFMAVGAYLSGRTSIALQTTLISGLPIAVSDQILFWVSLAAGGLAAALCGFVVGLPSLRLRGDYLAIVTLGFGEIIRVIFQNVAIARGEYSNTNVQFSNSTGTAWNTSAFTLVNMDEVLVRQANIQRSVLNKSDIDFANIQDTVDNGNNHLGGNVTIQVPRVV